MCTGALWQSCNMGVKAIINLVNFGKLFLFQFSLILLHEAFLTPQKSGDEKVQIFGRGIAININAISWYESISMQSVRMCTGGVINPQENTAEKSRKKCGTFDLLPSFTLLGISRASLFMSFFFLG